MNASIWATSSGTLWKDAPSRDLPARIREPDFDLIEPGGVRRREMDVLMTLQPHVALGLMGREIIENGVDFVAGIIGDDLVHEVEEFDTSSPLVKASDDLAAREFERREQRRCSMPLIVVRLAGHGAPVRQFQIALRAFERLDRRLLVNRQNNGAVRRSHVEADDFGGLGHEVGIVALAP